MFRTRSHLRDHMRIHTGMVTFMTLHIASTYVLFVFFWLYFCISPLDDMNTMKRSGKGKM